MLTATRELPRVFDDVGPPISRLLSSPADNAREPKRRVQSRRLEDLFILVSSRASNGL